ncbi:hypothetical protein CN918_28750 [Priestia megaterium]|nr:hypothetical protein CN918_28750 [Priestia megaterium]
MKRKTKKNMEGQSLFDVILILFFIGLLIIIGVSIILGCIFFGFVGLFYLFDGQYDSFWSLLLFLLIYWVVGILIDCLCIIVLYMIKGDLDAVTFTIIRLIVDCSGTLYALQTADNYMDSIYLPFPAKVVCALILFLIEVVFTPKNPLIKK